MGRECRYDTYFPYLCTMNGIRQQWLVEVTGEEKKALVRLLNEMRQTASSQTTASDSQHYKDFLPTLEQRTVYKRYVREYHSNYVAGRNIQHKYLMLHWAAIYAVIAKRTGISLFFGPEYDHFLMDFCGIEYNRSENRKGRYRQVGDVYRKYGAITDTFGLSENDAAMYRYFAACRKNFASCAALTRERISYGSGIVPGHF